jgi:hypothetical protein
MRYRAPRRDLTGERFGQLLVLGWKGNSRWLCQCECGKTAAVITANLNRGNTTSCGCVRNIASSKRATKHGLYWTPAYRTYLSVYARCCRPNKSAAYAQYGAKGVTMWEGWKGNPAQFIKDVGQPPTSEHTLDRIDNSKGYEPGNVRWATSIEQARNKSNNVRVEFQGQSFPSLSAFVEWLLPQTNLTKPQVQAAIENGLRVKP